MTPSDQCIALVRSFEGFRPEAYQDSGGIWTLAYGHTASVKEGDTCSLEQGLAWLYQDLQIACDCILNGLDCALTQNELDGLCSLVFNIGCGNFHHSTLRLKLSRGDYQGAADQFLVWNHIKGVVSDGLSRRREAERALFLSASS